MGIIYIYIHVVSGRPERTDGVWVGTFKIEIGPSPNVHKIEILQQQEEQKHSNNCSFRSLTTLVGHLHKQ